jgi:hypothetical protein
MTNTSTITYIKKVSEYEYRVKTTNHGHIHIRMSKHPKYCEEFYTYSKKGDILFDTQLDELLGKNISKIEYTIVNAGDTTFAISRTLSIKIHLEDETDPWVICLYNGHKSRTKSIKTYLEDDTDPWAICLYSGHNGYYPHDCMLDWNVVIAGERVKCCCKIESI